MINLISLLTVFILAIELVLAIWLVADSFVNGMYRFTFIGIVLVVWIVFQACILLSPTPVKEPLSETEISADYTPSQSCECCVDEVPEVEIVPR